MCVIMFNIILHATKCVPLIKFVRNDIMLYRVHLIYTSMLSTFMIFRCFNPIYTVQKYRAAIQRTAGKTQLLLCLCLTGCRNCSFQNLTTSWTFQGQFKVQSVVKRIVLIFKQNLRKFILGSKLPKFQINYFIRKKKTSCDIFHT